MKIKWYGTASISIDASVNKVLFDPFIPLIGSKVKTKLEDFDGYKYIFITHGHFDHIGSIKKLCKREKRYIYCTKTPYETLIKKGVSEDNLILIKPYDKIRIGDFEINVYPSKHVVFDKGALRQIVFSLRTYYYGYNIPYIAYNHKVCQENDEIVVFDILCENKKILMMGSLGIKNNVNYPTDYDLFLMPYQGKKDLLTSAKQIVDIVKPKKICITHFDNTFPPLSKNINVGDIIEEYKDKIEIIKPSYKREINI